MKRNVVALTLTAVGLLSVLAGCDWILNPPLTDAKRAEAFIASANENPQDPLELQAHFHPTETAEYAGMVSIGDYWAVSPFAEDRQPFGLGPLTEAEPYFLFLGTTALKATMTNDLEIEFELLFHFLDDPERPGNRLLRAIIVYVDGEIEDHLWSTR